MSEPSFDPADVARLVRFGLCSLEAGDQETARAAALVARSIDPEAVEPCLLLGAAEARLGRATQAVAAYREATRLDARNVRAWVDLGEAALMGLDYPTAAEALNAAMALDPEAKTAHGARAQLLVVDTLTRHGG